MKCVLTVSRSGMNDLDYVGYRNGLYITYWQSVTQTWQDESASLLESYQLQAEGLPELNPLLVLQFIGLLLDQPSREGRGHSVLYP